MTDKIRCHRCSQLTSSDHYIINTRQWICIWCVINLTDRERIKLKRMKDYNEYILIELTRVDWVNEGF